MGAPPQTARALLQNLTGEDCQPTEVGSLLTFTLLVGSRTIPCAAFESPGRIYATGRFRSRSGYVPVAVVTPTTAPRATIIYLPGGPGGPLLFQSQSPEANPLVEALVRRGYRILLFGYSGTAYQSAFPRSDVEIGAAQLQDYLDHWQAGPAAPERLAVAGISAGATVGYAAIHRRQIPLLLLSPPIDSPYSLVQRMKGRPRGAAYYARPVTLSIVEPGQGRRGREVVEEVRTAAFFGPLYSEPLAHLLRRLPPARPDCVSVIAGRDDLNIGVERLPLLAEQAPGMRVASVPGMGHGPRSIEEADTLAAVVAESLSTGPCATGAVLAGPAQALLRSGAPKAVPGSRR